jgi:hypothetical protein
VRRAARTLATPLLALVLVVGCTARVQVLATRDGGAEAGDRPVADCMLALRDGVAGQPCAFVDECRAQRSPCCIETLFCVDGRLERPPVRCEPGCQDCTTDAECRSGQLCDDAGRCAACPLETPDACPACPATFTRISRNGCATCDCLPPTECRSPAQCAAGEACVASPACAPRCPDAPTTCCASVCTATRCPGPPPLGCDVPCPTLMPCDRCVAVTCDCVDARWECRPVCAPEGPPICATPRDRTTLARA